MAVQQPYESPQPTGPGMSPYPAYAGGPLDIAFPKKGLFLNSARFAQPDNTVIDMTNMLPAGRDGRYRGESRPGTVKVPGIAMGTGTQPVQALAQTTLALDPATVAPTTLLFSDSFTYADNALDVAAPTIWHTSSTNNNGSGLANGSGDIVVISNTCLPNYGGTSNTPVCAALKTSLTLGVSFSLQASMTLHGTGSLAKDNSSKLITHINNSTFSNESENIYLAIHRETVQIRQGTATVAAFSFAGQLTTAAHLVELRVAGNTYTVFVDGVQYLTTTVVPATSVSGVGFGMGRGGGDNGDRVDNFAVYTAQNVASLRQVNIISVCGGNIYEGTLAAGMAVASGGSNKLADYSRPQIACRAGKAYFVDGYGDIIQLDLLSASIQTFTPTAGSETKTTLGANTLACIWRDRLVVAGPFSNPQNFFMSRQGTPTDWDYGQVDAAAAVAGNASRAGGIGEPLNCLIPFSDDTLLLGGDHSLYMVQGDIAAGGQIITVSEAVGTYGPDCWDLDPDGNLWFIGSGGLYEIAAGSTALQNKSTDSLRDFFNQINRSAQYVVCTWDRDRNGLWITLSPVNSGAINHMFYDASTGGFFPVQFPPTQGPMTAIVYDGDGPSDRILMLGGRDGWVRTLSASAATDDGSLLTSYVVLGPIRPFDEQTLASMTGLDIIMGDPPSGFSSTDWNAVLEVYSGKDVLDAKSSTAKLSVNVNTPQRRKHFTQRVTGGVFFFKIYNATSGKLFSLEKLSVSFKPSGLQRRY